MARRQRRAASTYLLQRQAAHPSKWSSEVTLSLREDDQYASFVPECALPTKARAEQRQRQLEQEARRATSIGPFLRTLLPERAGDIAAAAAAAGLPPPDLFAVGPVAGPKRVDYGGGLVGMSYGQDYFDYSHRVEAVVLGWWQAHAAEVTPEQNAALWDALFPEYRFYTVRRVPLEE
jgi:hypothetical protein